MIFNVDDIHRLRNETAEQYAGMSPEEARQDRRRNAGETLRAIEELRRTGNTRRLSAPTVTDRSGVVCLGVSGGNPLTGIPTAPE